MRSGPKLSLSFEIQPLSLSLSLSLSPTYSPALHSFNQPSSIYNLPPISTLTRLDRLCLCFSSSVCFLPPWPLLVPQINDSVPEPLPGSVWTDSLADACLPFEKCWRRFFFLTFYLKPDCLRWHFIWVHYRKACVIRRVTYNKWMGSQPHLSERYTRQSCSFVLLNSSSGVLVFWVPGTLPQRRGFAFN